MRSSREALLERLLHTERRLHMAARTEADKQRELLDKYRMLVEQWTQLDPSVADSFIKAFKLFIEKQPRYRSVGVGIIHIMPEDAVSE